MDSLPLFLMLRDRPVLLVGEGEAAAAKRRLLERAGARIVGEDGEAAVGIVALDDPDAAAARLRARGLLLNVVDRPDLSDFLMPAIVDRDPVLVAVGTGGTSAGLAAALRQRLETLIPARLGTVAAALRAARADLAERFPDSGERRRVLAALLAPGGPLDPLDPADDIAGALAAAAGAVSRLERLAIRTPDPDDLTLRQARALGLADRVYHPVDMALAILDRARADAARIVGDAPALLEPGLTVVLIWDRE